MPVQRIEQQNKSCLGNGIKSAAIGGVMGWAAQYALPLTEQEMDGDYKTVAAYIKNKANASKHENLNFIKSLRKKNIDQPALDVFERTVAKNNKNTLFKYNLGMKTARGAKPFIVAGAITGLMVSFIKNVFRTDVN